MVGKDMPTGRRKKENRLFEGRRRKLREKLRVDS